MPQKINSANKMQDYNPSDGRYIGKNFEKGFEKSVRPNKQKEESERMLDLMEKVKQFEGRKMDAEYLAEYKKFKEDNGITDEYSYVSKDTVIKNLKMKNDDGEEFAVKETWKKSGEHYLELIFGMKNPEDGKYYNSPKFGTKDELAEALNNKKIYFDKAKEAEKAEKEKEEAREAQVKENIKRYEKATNEEKAKMVDGFTNDELAELFSDEKLTEGTYVGGYKGRSKSNSAIASEEQGSKPKSKWTKDDIMGYIEDEPSLEPFYGELESMKISKLKDVALASDGWHHTGAFYGKTDYFSIASPYDIVLSLCSERKKFGEALKKGLKS